MVEEVTGNKKGGGGGGRNGKITSNMFILLGVREGNRKQ